MGSLTSTVATIEAHVTDRQRDVVESAIQLGYYDIPRFASQADIAAELDSAPSTIAKHLRKVESRILKARFA